MEMREKEQKSQTGRFHGLSIYCFIILLLVFSSCSLFENATDKNQGLVARKDYHTADNWHPQKIMGKDFRNIIRIYDEDHPDIGTARVVVMRELRDKPLFKESALNFSSFNLTYPNTNKVSIRALSPRMQELLSARPQAPFFITPASVRPTYRLMKPFECDYESYNVWKKANPNFMGCLNGETDNDFLAHAPWNWRWPVFKKAIIDDKPLVETIQKEFPKPRNREELTAQYMKACKAFRNYFFNDSDKLNYMCAWHCHSHYFYESGASIGWLETTNTGCPDGLLNFRHQIALFFARGAARQYNKNWIWYLAYFYNGYDDKGKFSGNNVPNYMYDRPKPFHDGSGGIEGPGYGMSPSLFERDLFLAYLSGASFLQLEWWECFIQIIYKGGKPTWTLSSPFGKAWTDWFEFTRKNPERGASYTPVALLVPFCQGYPHCGGKSWQIFKYERPDWMIDAFMFTIVPHSPVTPRGDEGGLSNSCYGDIYDVVVPDTPQMPVSIDVLNNYNVAVMLGRYKKDKTLAERLIRYVENGGTLILNIKQLNDFFPADFLGFEREKISGNPHPVINPVFSALDSSSFVLPEKYEFEPVALKKATPVLKDAAGNVMAAKNSYGKGCVIVVTVDNMLPCNNMENQEGIMLDKMIYGKRFPLIEYFLKNIVKEVLPLEVNGDVEYGLNRLPDGWLLYLINNKGVTKFTNKEQFLDISHTARVEVCLKDIKALKITELRKGENLELDVMSNSFRTDVPPGGINIIKITDSSLK